MDLSEILRGIGQQAANAMPQWRTPFASFPQTQTPFANFGQQGNAFAPFPQDQTPFADFSFMPGNHPTDASVFAPSTTGASSPSILSPAGTGDPNVLRWTDQINAASAKWGVPADVIAATMHIESHGDPNAKSGANAAGLMQVMPFHFQPGENPFDPNLNIDRGAQILSQNYAKWGDWDKAAAAYFGAIDGNGNITNAQDVGGQSGTGYVKAFNDARGLYPGTAARQAGQSPSSQTLAPGDVGKPQQDPHGGRVTQFDPELSAAEQLAACGPTAAAAIAGVSPRQALDMAKQNGLWDVSNGMHGAQSELQLLGKLGVRAHAGPVDWNAVDQTASPTTPVIVDTPGHYFYIDSADGRGNYHVGTSGTDLKHGSEWMTPAQMGAIMGAPRTLIFAGG